MTEEIEGESWKHTAEPDPEPESLRGLSRPQRQEKADTDYGTGVIDHDEWERVTNLLSKPRCV